MGVQIKITDFYEESDFIQAKFDDEDVDLIHIKGYEISGNTEFNIYLDKSSAIRFAKMVRTEINKMKEVNHG